MRITISTVAGLILLLAGCGANHNQPRPGSSAGGQADGVRAAYRFSACMRAHGVPNFPDPKVVNSPGKQSVGIAVKPSSSPAFASAQKACRGILPPPGSGGPSPAEQHAKAQHLLAFARCM